MKIGIGQTVLATLCLICCINGFWIINTINLSDKVFAFILLLTIASTIGVVLFFISFIINFWD